MERYILRPGWALKRIIRLCETNHRRNRDTSDDGRCWPSTKILERKQSDAARLRHALIADDVQAKILEKLCKARHCVPRGERHLGLQDNFFLFRKCRFAQPGEYDPRRWAPGTDRMRFTIICNQFEGRTIGCEAGGARDRHSQSMTPLPPWSGKCLKLAGRRYQARRRLGVRCVSTGRVIASD